MDTPEAASRHSTRSGTEPSWTLDRRRVQRDAVLARLRDARFPAKVFCPRCGHGQVQRWGTFSGRQRYRCSGCRRTFSDLTGTPVAYLKKIELLPAYGDCLASRFSVRGCAFRLGVDPSTAFRWRHRLLDGLRGLDTESVSGWVELGSFWLPESHKGVRMQRDSGRPKGAPGRRSRNEVGSRRRWNRWNLFYHGPRVHVAVACDRAGHLVSGASPYSTKGPLTAEALEAALEGRIRRSDPLNVTASHASRAAAKGFSFRIGATYHDAFPVERQVSGSTAKRRGAEQEARAGRGTSRRPRPVGRSLAADRALAEDRAPVPARPVIPYIRQFREWLRGFRGVATRYLPNYLLWHRLVDSSPAERFQSLLLHW